MKTEHEFSDEFLNAYIDGELSDQEKSVVIDEIRHNHQLGERICKLRKTRDMIQLAYENIPMPPHFDRRKEKRSGNRLIPAVAASVLLIIGGLTGWFISNNTGTPNGLLSFVQGINTQKTAQADELNLLLQITTMDSAKLKTMLDETEYLLSQNGEGENVHVAILANGPGLDLLRADKSPYAERIRYIQQKYRNVSFLACRKTIENARIAAKREIELLPDTSTVPSALEEVVHRLKDGWAYIKI